MNLSFSNRPFPLLDKKQDRYFLILFCLVFGILFINIFVPFNINRWFSDSAFIQFLRLSSFGLIVSLVLWFTQFPLRTVFKIHSFTIKSFSLWFLLETILTSLVYIFLYGNPLGNFVNDFIFSLKYTFLGIVLPYSFVLVIIHYKNRQNKISPQQVNLNQPLEKSLISFKDESGKIRFSAQPADVLLLESTDNYITVHYLFGGKVHRKLLRNTLKNIEDTMSKNGFIRCHRSFMVNTQNISFVQKEGKKMVIRFKQFDKVIPVSEKYSSLFLRFLS
jgi:hypothetical protein